MKTSLHWVTLLPAVVVHGFQAGLHPHSTTSRMLFRRAADTTMSSSILWMEPPNNKDPMATLEAPVVPQSTGVEEDTTTTKNEDVTKKDAKQMMQQIKDAGLAGVISYALWELGFWTISIPLTLIGYQRVTGHWPDLNDKEDIAKLSAEAFAFVNFARFAVPLRIGLALSTTSWIQTNIVDTFIKKKGDGDI